MNPFRTPATCLLLIVACAFATSCPAKIMLAPPFTDHAVLQRDQPVPVWGWDTEPGATITVSFHGQTKESRVNQSGLWRVDLDAMPASGEGADLIVTGSTLVTLHDVVVGEVWLASGQSNMEFTLNNARTYPEEQARAANPLIRHLKIEHEPADLPVASVRTSGWQSASPKTIGGFSAVGYFFAQDLAEKLNVPVGILHASWGGTPIESWIPESVLCTTRGWSRFNAQWQKALKVFPQKYAEQPALEAAWQKAEKDFHATGKPIALEWPRPPMGPGSAYAPGRLFNGMIAPLAPYALRGALWYQGESNVGHHDEYRELLPTLIASWRAAWPQGDFPFLLVQLPNFADNNPAGRSWAQLREAQESALHVPATGMAVIIDVGDPDNIHPTNKRPVGERLALIALHQIYDQRTVEWSGPVVQSIQPEGSALRIKFSHATDLALHPSQTPTTGFEVAGSDKVVHAATAQLTGDTLVVMSPDVAAPVAVRYAWTNLAPASLFTGAGLPAAPFRSDEW